MRILNLAMLGGLVLGQAANAGLITYDALLSGPNEAPPNTSPGTGSTTVTIDSIAQTMRVQVVFSGLLGTTTASHIHCCTAVPGTGTAGVATTVPYFVSFPLSVMSGTYDMTLDLTSSGSYNPSFVTAHGGTNASAEAALLAGIAAGDAYLNIHTNVDPGGEIRGFLVLAPEPATCVMAGAALAGLAILRRKRAA